VVTRRRRRLDVERLAEAQRAAKVAGASAGQWWKELATAAETATTERSLDELLSESIGAMRDALEVDTVAVLLANEAGDELVARAATGLSQEAAAGLGVRAGEGMAGWVLDNRRPLMVADLAKITVASPELRTSGLHSVVAVPMLLDEHPLGVLYAGSYEEDRFTTADSGVLELLAERLASAIERVRLFETERTARTEAEGLASRLARMQRITSALAAASTTEEVATGLVQALVEPGPGRGLTSASLWLRQGETLLPLASAPTAEGPALEVVPLDSHHPVAVAARTGRAATLETQLERPPPAGSSAVVAVPVMLGGTCLGVLVVAGAAISPEERDVLDDVVPLVAETLERARLSVARDQLAQISAFFARAAKVLAEGSDLRDTLERLGTIAVPTLGDLCLIDVLGEDGQIVRMVARHRDPALQHLADRLRTRFAPLPGGPHPSATVIATGRTRWSREMPDEFLIATTNGEEHLAITRALGFRSFISVPLRSGEDTLGCVTLVSSSRDFDPDDVTFAEQLAEQVAAVVAKARRVDIADRTSHVLQSTLLPQRLPELPGLALYTRYVAASEGLEVGGDFFDVVQLTEHTVAFMIGDVAGHDRIAAGLMGQLRSAARTLVGRVDSPVELLDALQQSWDRLDFHRIATAIVGELDLSSGSVAMASAGHHPPLLVEPGASRYLRVPPGTPLGVEGPPRQQWAGRLLASQALLLYTDGAIDTRRDGTDGGMAQLAAAVASAGRQPVDLAALCERVVGRLSPDREDDVALLALQLAPG
jgi:GAF domain-containing protein